MEKHQFYWYKWNFSGKNINYFHTKERHEDRHQSDNDDLVINRPFSLDQPESNR